MEKLKGKRYIALLLIVFLFTGLIALLTIGNNDKYNGLVKVKDTSISTKLLSSTGAFIEEDEVKGNSTIEYKINFTLESVPGVETRTVIIKASLSDEESLYARFKDISKAGVSSTLSNNGKDIEVEIENVRLGVEKELRLKLILEGAPNGFKVKPSIRVNEKTGEERYIDVEELEVVTNTVEGIVTDENDLPVSNIEVVAKKNGNEVKRTYTKEDGSYIITDLENDIYQIDIDEEKYEIVNIEEIEVSGNTNVDISVKEVEPYTIETHKYIEHLHLVIDGNEKDYDYQDATEVVEDIKRASNISGEIEYKIEVRNVGEKSGTINKVEDIASEGLKLIEEKNIGWEQVEDKLLYRPIEGTSLAAGEVKNIGLTLEIESTEAAKTYINRITANGELYEKVVYILNGVKYRELDVVDGEKIEEPTIEDDDFSGWYTDKNRTNKYNFDLPVTKDLILYGTTEREKFNVKFINGSEVIDEIIVNKNDRVEPIEGPTKTGYDFKYWSETQDGEAFDFNTRITEDKELYAVFEIKKFNVKFINDGTTYTEKVVNYNNLIPMSEIENPSKEHYTFKYWSLTTDGNAYDLETPVTTNITLYAVYQINKYTVKYYDDGEVIRQIEVDANSLIQPIEVSKTGYTFKYWKDNSGSEFNFSTPILSDTNLYSEYEIIRYNITYNETVSGNPLTYTVEDEEIVLNNPTKDGYTFTGWTGTGLSDKTMRVSIPHGSTGDRNYESTYETIKYNITYNLNGGSLEEGKTNPDKYTIETDTFTLNNPSKVGYTFSGWTGTDLNEPTNPVSINKGSIGDRHYVANYTINKYTVEFYDNDNLYKTMEVEYQGTIDTSEIENPSKEGHTFTFWSLKNETNAFDFSTQIVSNIKLYSNYKLQEKEVIFNDENRIETVPVNWGETVSPMDSKGKRGYTFKHWSETQNGETFDFSTPILETKTLYAVYEIDTYEIEYDLDDGTASGNPTSYTVTTDTFTLNNPSKTGYDFDGWTGTEVEGTKETVTIEKGSIGDRSYKAHYSPIEYDITYVLDGGSLPEGETNPGKYTIESEDITIKNPSKVGYTFVGWSEGSGEAQNPFVISKGSTGDKTLTAVYQINTYTVTFIDNGSQYGEIETVDYNTKATRLVTDPSKEGYTFKHWSLTENGPEYDFDTPVTDNIVLYSVYQINTYTVTFMNEGTKVGEDDVNYNEQATKPENDPTKTGYTFKHWSETQNGPEYVFTTPVVDNITLYAVYQINTYTVTFMDNGSQYGDIQTVNYNTKATKPENNPSMTGYTFKHWSLTENGTEYNFDTLVTDNIVLYSVYQINTYTVTFMNGENQFDSKIVNYNQPVSAPTNNPTKAHNIFLNWLLNNEPYNFELGVTEDLTLYSSFEEVVAPTISHSPTEWTKDNVTVTITSEHEDYTYYYNIDGGSNRLYEGPFEVEQNCTVNAYSVKSSISSVEASHDIDNIDKINPNILSLENTTLTPVSATIKINMQDNESGLGLFKVYNGNDLIYTSPDYSSSYNEEKEEEYTVTGLNEIEDYVIRVEVIDRVGNVSEDSINITTPPKHYVCRTLDATGVEIHKFESITEALESTDCSSNCHIQMIDNTEESNNILEGQTVTLDINGYTITGTRDTAFNNNYEFTVIDTAEEPGKIYSSGIAIYNNHLLTIGVNDTNPQVVSKTQPVIEGTQYGIQSMTTTDTNVGIHFYDGKIIGNVAVKGDVTDTPYLYNTTVKDDTTLNKQVETLTQLAEAEARIRSTYYTKVQGGVDESKNGEYVDKTINSTILSQLITPGDYGFAYDESTGKAINDNNSMNKKYYNTSLNTNTVAHSYVEIDLTDYDEPQLLTINAQLNCYGTYNGRNYGYIYITESKDMPDLSSTEGRLFADSGSYAASDYQKVLENGKEYYVHFVFTNYYNSYEYEELFTINSMYIGEYEKTSISDLNNAVLLHNSPYYFRKQQDGSYISYSYTDTYSTYSDSYMVIDLTDVDENKYILVDASSSYYYYGKAYIAVTSDSTTPTEQSSAIQFVVGEQGTTARKTAIIKLNANQVNFVHFVSYRGYRGYDNNNFTIYSIRTSEDKKSDVTDGTLNDKEDYHFEELDYSPVIWKDLSGNKNNGTLNGPTINADENGFVFNGNSFVPIKKLNLEETTWQVKFNATGTGVIIANYESGGMGVSIGSDRKLKEEIYLDGAYRNLYSLEPIEYNRDYVVTLTLNNNVAKLYLDGVLQDTYEGTTYKQPESNTVVMLGAGPAGSTPDGSYYSGTIYNAKIYNRELSEDEITGTASDEGLLVHLDASDYKKSGTYYVSNNRGVSGSTANSYMVFDLTDVPTPKTLKVNVTVSSENYDVGYITVKNTPDYPAYNDTSGRYVYVSNYSTGEYNVTLPANQVSYVHFGYMKDGGTNRGSDSFVINSIAYYMDSDQTIPTYILSNDTDVRKEVYNLPELNQETDTVQILRDITLTSPLEIVPTRDVVLDLNGYTLTTSKDDYVIKNYGSLKIIDSKYTGDVQAALDKYNRETAQYQAEYEAAMAENQSIYEQDLIDYETTIDEFLDEYNKPQTLERTFDYTNHEEVFIVPYSGTYKLETWGASGADHSYNNHFCDGGYGGYSEGEIYLNAGDKLYINVGGVGLGDSSHTYRTGGYNGGGNATSNGDGNTRQASGGGATSIARSSGTLYDLGQNDKQSDVIIVAGGGGGAGGNAVIGCSIGGSGGGIQGTTGSGYREGSWSPVATGGTQDTGGSSGGTFGRGGSDTSAGGGGGYYGGGASAYSAGGGSGYINGLSNAQMVVYGTDTTYESSDPETKTTLTEAYSDDPEENTTKNGHGYAKITLLNNKTDYTREEIKNILDTVGTSFNYTGEEEVYEVPVSGKYTIETWGASGGDANSTYRGGYGAYSRGTVHLNAGDKLYINVGGAGSYCSINNICEGGYNGGGTAYVWYESGSIGASGGGATSVATSSGKLSELENNQEAILIVSGGGAGGAYTNGSNYGIGGNGGGIIGGTAYATASDSLANGYGTGGTQTSGGALFNRDGLTTSKMGSFGQGFSATAQGEPSGAGGGYYGGGGSNHNSSGGGSSYIGNSLLRNKYMTCYDCETSDDYSTKTLTTSNVSSNPETNYAKIGDGYVKISISTPELDEAVLKEAVLETDYELTGNVSSTTNSVIFNGYNSYLNISEGLINLNKSGSYNVITNKGLLTLGDNAYIKGLQDSNIGILNSESGDILTGSGNIVMTSTNNIGILNEGVNEEEIKGYKLSNSSTSSKNIHNRSINDLVLDNITSDGQGIDIYQDSNSNLTVKNSNLNSTGNESYYSNESSAQNNITFYKSNIRNRVYNRLNSNRNIYINECNMDSTRESNVLSFAGYVEINDSILTHSNWNLVSYGSSRIVANDSTFNANNHSITSGTDGYYSGGQDPWRYYIHGNITLNNVDINTKCTSDTYIIYNYDQTTINGGSVNNIKNSCSLAYNGENSYHLGSYYYGSTRPLLTITGDFTTTDNFNNGVYSLLEVQLVIGEDDGDVSTSYPLIQATNKVLTSQETASVKMFDGKLVGKTNNSIDGQINEIPDNYELYVGKGETLEEDILIPMSVTSSEDYYVARIGSTKYTTLQAAINAAPNNTETEIVLIKDIENASTVIVDNSKNIIVNMDNHSIKAYNSQNFIINNGIIKFTNSELNDTKIIGYGSPLIVNNNKMTIENIKIYQLRNYLTLIENNDDLTINGSEIYTTLSQTINISTTYYTRYTSSTPLINNKATLTINASNIHSYETMLINSSGDVTVNGGSFTITSGYSEDYSIFINNTSTEGVVTLNNVASTINYNNSGGRAYKNAGTIYSNGGKASISGYCSYNCYPSYYIINYSGASAYIDGTEFTDTHGKIISSAGYAEIKNINSSAEHGLDSSGTMKIEDSTFIRLHYNSISNSGTMTITGSSMSGDATIVSNSGKLDIDDSTIDCTYNHSTADHVNTRPGVSLSGSQEVNISNSTISGNYGIQSSNTGTVTLDNDTITGRHRSGIYNTSTGTLNIIGGSSQGKEYGLYNTGSSIINIGTQGDGTVAQDKPEIKGNNFGLNNTNADATVNFYDGVLIGATAINGAISATETGYSIILEERDGLEYKYLDRVYIVENTRTHDKYYTIQEGIDAAGTGDTLEVLRELTVSSSDPAIEIESTKDVTLDMKGYKFVVGNSTFIENEGKFTITSSKTDDETGDITNGYIEAAGSKIIDNSGDIYLSYIDIRKTINNNVDIIYNSGTMNTDNIKVYTGIDGMSSWLINNGGIIISNNSEYLTYNTKIMYNTGTITSTTDKIKVTKEDNYDSKINMIYNESTGVMTFNNLDFRHMSRYYPSNSDSYLYYAIENLGEVNINDGTIREDGSRGYWGDVHASLFLENKLGATANIDGTSFVGSNGIIAHNYGTIDITDVTSSFDSAIMNYSGGIANVTDSSFTAISRYSLQNSGTLTVDNIVIRSSGTTISNSADATITNSTLTSTSSSSSDSNISNSGSGTLTIDGVTIITGQIGIGSSGTGNINLLSVEIDTSNYGINNSGAGTITLGVHADGTVSKTNPSIRGNSIGLNNTNNNAVINFYDGILIGNSAHSGSITNLEDNYEIINETVDGLENEYLDRTYVMQNITKSTQDKYYTIQEAINDASVGDTLLLLRKATVLPNENTILVDSTKDITIDLNGYLITTNNALFLTNNGKLTMTDNTKTTDSVGTGGITSNISQIFENNGTLTFEGGTYLKTLDYTTNNLLVNTGKVIINNGKLTMGDSHSGANLIETSNELEINGGEISTFVTTAINNTSKLKITGGVVKKNSTYCYINDSPYYLVDPLIKNSTTGEITISGGEINGIERINNGITGGTIYSDGLLSITGGTFIQRGDYSWSTRKTGVIVYNDTNGTTTITGGTFNGGMAGLIINKGIATVENITSTYEAVGVNSGTLTLDNCNFTSISNYVTNNHVNNSGGLVSSGTLNIIGGSYTGSTLIINNYGNLSMNGTTISGSTGLSLSSSGTNTIDNSTITASGTAISISGSTTTFNTATINAATIVSSSGGTINLNSITGTATSTAINNGGGGTINLNSGTYSTTNGLAINNTSTGTINVKSGTYSTTNGNAVNNTSTGTITFGESGGAPSNNDPYIIGTGYGLNNTNNNAHIYFYDGIISGQTGSIYGLITDVEPGYKEVRNPNVIDDVQYTSSTLTPLGDEDVVVEVNHTNFASVQSAVNYAVANEIETISLRKDFTLEADLIKPDGIDVKIYTNGHTLNTGSYTVDSGIQIVNGSAPSGLGGAIYKFLADITGTELNPHNIIIYQMEDGSVLNVEETYKLYKFNIDAYEVVKVDENNLGDYNIGSDKEEMNVIKGRLYINNIGEGSYKLVGSDNKEINFEVYADSVSSNIRINTKAKSSRTSTALATLILTFGTGVAKSPYMLLMMLFLIVIILSIIAVNRRKKSYN